jgi:selenocysteine lyase/cysteine desulfurase
VTAHTIPIELPTTKEKIVAQFQRYLMEMKVKPRLCIMDHITSSTALIFPVQQLIQLCKRFGIFTLVDGAHAIGQIPVDLAALDPDFYISNCHKWMFVPRGCGKFENVLSYTSCK